ncbi:hypothetical protein LCGC14_0586620 [marine sediment metagenome]|uniref:Uncharacterized protein n=1 Tax=marine sediment metagenome TaxID=412755 RepID=A0A0F9U129_9ZZZZ
MRMQTVIYVDIQHVLLKRRRKCLTYRFGYNKEVEKWGVINENGDYIIFSETKEGAIELMNDLNESSV